MGDVLLFRGGLPALGRHPGRATKAVSVLPGPTRNHKAAPDSRVNEVRILASSGIEEEGRTTFPACRNFLDPRVTSGNVRGRRTNGEEANKGMRRNV